jgi:hypothetical protein
MPKFEIVVARKVRRVYIDDATLTIEADNIYRAIEKAQVIAREPRTEGVQWDFNDDMLTSEKVLLVSIVDIDSCRADREKTPARLVRDGEGDGA